MKKQIIASANATQAKIAQANAVVAAAPFYAASNPYAAAQAGVSVLVCVWSRSPIRF